MHSLLHTDYARAAAQERVAQAHHAFPREERDPVARSVGRRLARLARTRLALRGLRTAQGR